MLEDKGRIQRIGRPVGVCVSVVGTWQGGQQPRIKLEEQNRIDAVHIAATVHVTVQRLARLNRAGVGWHGKDQGHSQRQEG
jgi:hypothetical protein